VAFTRLHEMDVEPFLVSSSTIGVIAQRLARRLCQECREPYTVDANIAGFWGLAEKTVIYRGRGCGACGGKGVRGRVGVYEVMKVTPRLRAMIGTGTRSEEIHAAAIEEGMIDLKRYSAWLLTEGLTSVEEVTSVVSVDI
jgi:type IV pilus assembly protein PilB